jgi:hypothetical protein
MINIVCLKWGTKYGPEYVNNLYRGVARNTTLPFSFHCFTDNATGIDSPIVTHPLVYPGLDGWWNKLYLFSKELPIEGRIMYLDLDTLITGNIDDILRVNEGFVVLRDFLTGIWKGITTNDFVGSGIMSYEAHQHSYLWEDFIKNSKEIIKSIKPHGDQVWIQRQQLDRLYWQDIVPQQIVSFKVHCKGSLAPDARIVCYHGKPSIPDSITQETTTFLGLVPKAPWVKNYWK